MALIDALRSGIGVLHGVTKGGGLQTSVRLKRMKAQTSSEKTYYGAVTLTAHVDAKSRLVQTSTGELKAASCTLTFTSVSELSDATGGRGLTVNDVISIAGGPYEQILSVGGYQDPVSGFPVATEAYVG